MFARTDAGPTGAAELTARAAAAIQSTQFEAHDGLWLDLVGKQDERRIVLLGVGSSARSGRDSWLATGAALLDAMRALRIGSVRLPKSSEIGDQSALYGILLGALLHGYHLDQGRNEDSGASRPETIVIDDADGPNADEALRIANAVNRARAWVEQPANLLSPAIFAQEAASVLEACGATVRVLGLAELEQIGAGALIAVGQASVHEPKLLVAEWRGAPERDGCWDAALVGKGITFDGGGLNIKSRPVIEKMKFDMGGAAAVLGAMELAMSRHARANLVAVVPMAENVIGGRGMRPGDVIRSLSGLTVEILNTDAEGRLVLADGITYAIDHYKPAAIVDIATLTGLITGVLHEEYAGLYASEDRLANALLNAGAATGELLWRMPLTPKQNYLVESSVADVANLGAPGFLGLGIGSPTAGAKFIERFAGDTPWAHIDIAGTAWATRKTSRSQPGATGFGVALIDEWLAGLENERDA
ncbi:hypothetical protein ASE00_07520 [Sphingomonas sp. Root710]|nr:hypothetical protein ASE00_07520 [Sphingomonas sp. Root710]